MDLEQEFEKETGFEVYDKTNVKYNGAYVEWLESRIEQLTIGGVMSRFDVEQQDIYKINGIIRDHIEDASSGYYTNIEDEKNHIRGTLYDIVEIALNGS